MEISQLEQLGRKKQKLFEQQVSRAELFDCAKEHELSHLQQQANQAQLVQSVIASEASHLHSSFQKRFSLPYHHLSLEEAVKFLNAKDPERHKWNSMCMREAESDQGRCLFLLVLFYWQGGSLLARTHLPSS